VGDPLSAADNQLSRRDLVAGALGFASCLAVAPALSMGRVPVGGTLTLRVPFSTRSLDPHDLYDPLAAFFGSAIADTVYARDAKGNVYPALADGFPLVEEGQTVVRLRRGLRSARGRALGGRDLAWSIKRARNMGAAGLLAPLTPWVRSDKKDPLIARFGKIDPGKLSLLLSSPLVALLPVGFSPRAPDGSGPFSARCSATTLQLSRNRSAARGPAFLERIDVHVATNMASSLRAFESGQDDLGWLGTGFHGTRPGARKFNFGTVAWVVLLTGRQANAFGVAGTAQQLANAVPVERLALGLRGRPALRGGSLWHGDPTELYFDSSSAQLKIIADAVASKLSQKGHEVTATAVTRSKLRRLRSSGGYTLALDVVRHPQAGPIAPLIALATADRIALGRDMARHPPRIRYNQPVHHMTTSLRVGVLGGLEVRGGVAPKITLVPAVRRRGFNLGGSYRAP